MFERLQKQDVDVWAMIEEGEIKDPETGETFEVPHHYGIHMEKTAYITLAGGGPSVRIVAEFDYGDTEPFSVDLQHAWATPWANLPLAREQQDGLQWYYDNFVYIDE